MPGQVLEHYAKQHFALLPIRRCPSPNFETALVNSICILALFFILSKLLLLAFSPGLWLLLLLGAAVVARPTGRWRGRWLGAAVVLLLIGGNNALINCATLAWELPPVPLRAVAPADAAVLLTGVTAEGKSPHDRVYLTQGADRLTNALWLYRAGRVRYLIISGGSGSLHPAPGAESEAHQLATLLRLAAVPASAILLEERSRNTRENALYTQALLRQYPGIKALVLVTSAFHERRALGCFAKVGLRPVPFPADFRSTDPSGGLGYWVLPSLDALNRWGNLLHEIVGYLVYKVQGYC